MKPCPNCVGGVWVVRDTPSSGKRDFPVFACKEQRNLPLSARLQDNALRKLGAILSPPATQEDAAPASQPSHISLSTAIPTSIREDSPEIPYHPPVLSLPVAKMQDNDPTPNSVPFKTGAGVDKRNDADIQGTVAPLTLQPPGAVHNRLSNDTPRKNTLANVKYREERKRKLRKSSRKCVTQLDFVDDDSDVDRDWAPDEGFDFSRIDSVDDCFSDDGSASDDGHRKRKRRNASSKRELAKSSLVNLTENAPIISTQGLASVEAVIPMINTTTARPTRQVRPPVAAGKAATGNVKKPNGTVETVLKSIKFRVQSSRIEKTTINRCNYSKVRRVQIGPVSSSLVHLPENGPVSNPRTVTDAETVMMTTNMAVTSRIPDIPSHDDDSASNNDCMGIEAGSAGKSTGNRKVNPADGSTNQCNRTITAADDETGKPTPQPKIERTTVDAGPGRCPMCWRQCPNVALHVRQYHVRRRTENLVLATREADLGLEHLDSTGSFGYCCCGCYYPSKAVWELHQTVHRQDPVESAERVCPWCGLVAESFDDLVRHTSQHALDAEADKLCFLCEWTGTDLFGHWRASHRELKDQIRQSHKFRCKLCRDRYRSGEELEDHAREIHPSDESRESAAEYMQRTGFLSYYCPACVQYFPSKRLLDLHEFMHGPVDIQPERLERQCPACEFVGLNFSSLVDHISTHAVMSSGKKQCLFCSDQLVALWPHYTRFHPEFRDFVSKNWTFQCEHCDQKFMTEHRLKQHLRMTHIEAQCLYCALRFPSDVKLTKHVRAEHTKDNGFPCPVCPKSFSRHYRVLIHYRSVHDIGQVVLCDVCQRVFRNKLLLKRHFMGKHSNEYGFACKQCEKKYKTYLLLHQHVERHHKWTEADRKKFNDRQKERRAAHKKKALEKDSDKAEE